MGLSGPVSASSWAPWLRRCLQDLPACCHSTLPHMACRPLWRQNRLLPQVSMRVGVYPYTWMVIMCWRQWTVDLMIRSKREPQRASISASRALGLPVCTPHACFYVCTRMFPCVLGINFRPCVCRPSMLPAAMSFHLCAPFSHGLPFPGHRHSFGYPVCSCCDQPNHPYLQWLHGPDKPRLSHP